MLILDRSLEETLPYLFSLLGIDDPNSTLQQMDAQIRRQRTFEALKKLFLRESLNQPLLLFFEDLHWIDTETQGFLDSLSESVASAQLLLLVNYRPEYRHAWGTKTYYTQLRLASLGQVESEELLTSLLGADPSLLALKALILEKTEGTPFFLEEVVQTLVEEGGLVGDRGHYRLETSPTELHIPPTVQGVLAARIDRLTAEEKALLQQLSVIGRQSPVSLIQHVVAWPEAELYRVLAALQAKEFLYEQPAFPEVEYLFKHALTQDVAYGTLLQEQRKALHERTGQAMEVLYGDSLEEHYSELAHHYYHSEHTEKAVVYLSLAGQQAAQRYANKDAVESLRTALELLRTLPQSPERDTQELTVLLSYGPVLLALGGFDDREIEHLYLRAQTLCQLVGEPQQLFPILRGRYTFFLVHAELEKAHALGEQFLEIAQQTGAEAFQPEAHFLVGQTLLFQGDFRSARPHFERNIVLYDPQQHHHYAFLFGLDSGVFSSAQLGWALWLQGYPNQSVKKMREALTLAETLAHPFTLSFTLTTSAAIVQLLRRDSQAVYELSDAGVRYSAELGFPHWGAFGTIARGWAIMERGQADEGIRQMQQGWVAAQASGMVLIRPFHLAWLAEAYGKVGRAEEGLTVLAEALHIIHRTHERLYEAELYRLRGELLLSDDRQMLGAKQQSEDAEASFQQALAVARQQAAKSWELRAATSLARLWQQQGKTTEACELLAPVYGWFTEGFDTADLKDAKMLLDTLS